MSVKFYDSENCDATNEKLSTIFNTCNSLYGIGNDIDTTESTTNQDWDTLQITLAKFIPFLVERKFKYYRANQRADNDTTDPNTSNEIFFTSSGHAIRKIHLGDLQPDDVIKENIVNNFSDKLFINCKSFYQNLLFKLTEKQEMRDKLGNYYDNDIKDLKKELVKLNNDKLIEENTYSSKYYKLKNYETNIDILINSIFIVSLIFVIGILTNNGIIDYGYIINVILLIVLVIYLLLSLKTIRDRQYSNWDKRYFDYVNDISDKV